MKKLLFTTLIALCSFASFSQEITLTSERNETNPEWLNVQFSNDGKHFYQAIIKSPKIEKVEDIELLNPPANYDARSTGACYLASIAACMANHDCNIQLAVLGPLGQMEIWTACFFNILH